MGTIEELFKTIVGSGKNLWAQNINGESLEIWGSYGSGRDRKIRCLVVFTDIDSAINYVKNPESIPQLA